MTFYKDLHIIAYEFQKRLVNHWEDNHFSISGKFRQGGFTTLATIYALWLCLFKEDQKITFVCRDERLAADIGDGILKCAIKCLPDWLKGNILKMTAANQKKFEDTNSSILFVSPMNLSLSQNISLFILDEIDSNFKEKYWQSIYTLCFNSKAIIQSTLDGQEGWFWEKLMDSRIGVGEFKEFRCHYKELYNEVTEERMKKYLSAVWSQQMGQQAIDKEEKPVVIEKIKKWRNINDQ